MYDHHFTAAKNKCLYLRPIMHILYMYVYDLNEQDFNFKGISPARMICPITMDKQRHYVSFPVIIIVTAIRELCKSIQQ